MLFHLSVIYVIRNCGDGLSEAGVTPTNTLLNGTAIKVMLYIGTTKNKKNID